MFDLIQVAAKVVIIAVVIGLAAVVSWRVWRLDLDLRLITGLKRAVKSSIDEKLSWLPAREENALYQGGMVVARVAGADIDELKSRVLFLEIYESNQLNYADEFEFRKWRLKARSIETEVMLDASAPQKGRILERVTCEIVGLRPAL